MSLMNENAELVSKPPAAPAAAPEPEPDYEQLWGEWRKVGSNPQANAAMLRALHPVIDKAATAQVGTLNPLARSRARSIALQALGSYDPKRGRLVSHLYNHMQGLKRYNAQATTGVRVPERAMLDRRALALGQQELSDELGREPTDDELAERTGFSLKRIRKVRGVNPGMNEGMFSAMGEGGEPYSPGVQSATGAEAWLKLIYDDLPPVDKKILEWTLGYNGQAPLDNQTIARKLNLSPGRISQRKLAIQAMLDKEMALSPFSR